MEKAGRCVKEREREREKKKKKRKVKKRKKLERQSRQLSFRSLFFNPDHFFFLSSLFDNSPSLSLFRFSLFLFFIAYVAILCID